MVGDVVLTGARQYGSDLFMKPEFLFLIRPGCFYIESLDITHPIDGEQAIQSWQKRL